MKRTLLALALGVLFGVGLLVSQMSNPAKIIGFLDATGAWDPSLAFVMAGAVTVFGLAYRLSLRRQTPLLEAKFHVPERRRVDAPLLLGAGIFGTGWGLAGFCPGPAVVAAAFGDARVWVFIAAMAAGIVLLRIILPQRSN
jgi:uncharacterized membrane protein YedE/YeeE